MKTLFKAAAALLVLGLAFAAAATVALKIWLPPEKARQLVVDSARKALKRDVRLKGLSIGLFSGVTAEGLEVSEDPDFSAGVFAQASSFRLRLSLMPLLRKKIVVDSVALVGLKLALTRGKDKALRLPGGAPAAPPSVAAAAPFELAVRKASIKDGSVLFKDEAAGLQWSINGISARLSDFGLERPFDLETGFSAEGRVGGRPVKAAVSFAGRVDSAGGDPGKMSVAIRKLSVTESGMTLTASGTASAGPKPKADLKLSLRAQGEELLSAELRAEPGAQAGATQAKFSAATPGLSSKVLSSWGAPAGLSLPAARLAGLVRVEGQDASLEGLTVETAWGRAALDGTVRGALAGKPKPDLKTVLKLDLPAFESASLPFAGLPAGLSFPAAHIEGGLSFSLDEVKFKALRLKTGGTELEAEGALRGLGAKPSADLLLKCRSFVLDELTRISPATRELGLTGKGLFALGVTGSLEKPLLAGKLQFQGVGADVGGLKLSELSGLAKFDERRIDVPNVKGLLAGAQLAVDLTVKDYAKAADVDFVAELSQFDLGSFLAARAKEKKISSPEGAAVGPGAQRPPLRAKGKLTVAKLIHPNAAARDAKLSWELEGITPDLKSLDGWAKLSVGAGSFNDLGIMAAQSPVMKILVLPIMLLQKIGSIGGIRLFPDLNNIQFSEIGGDYVFRKGMMQIRDSHLFSEAVHATTTGSIDLPREALDLVVSAQVGRVAPIDVGVTGTFEKPVAKPKIAKFLAEPAKQLLQNILKFPQ